LQEQSKQQILSLQRELELQLLQTEPFSRFNARSLQLALALASHRQSVIEQQASNTISGSSGLNPVQDKLSFGLWLAHHRLTEKVNNLQDPVADGMAAFDQLGKYCWVYDMLRMCLSGGAACYADNDHYVFKPRTDLDFGLAVIEQHLSNIRSDLPILREMLFANEEATMQCFSSVRTGPITLSLISRGALTRSIRLYERHLELTNLFPESLEIHGYTFSQIRHLFCAAVVATTVLQGIAVRRSHERNGGDGNFVPMYGRDEWATFFQQHTGFLLKETKAIIDDLTYAPDTLTYPDSAFCLPFVKIDNQLALLPMLLYQAPIDEIAYREIVLKQPHAMTVRNHKEEYQRSRINSFLKTAHHIETYGPFKTKRRDGTPGDLDLLIVDKSNKVGLSCELKFLATPRWVHQVQPCAEEFTDAMEKCGYNLDWLSQCPESVCSALRLSKSELVQYKFEGLVISTRTLGAGLSTQKYPITNEQILRDIIVFQGANLDLLKIHSTCLQRPLKGVDYDLSNVVVDFLGRKFTGVDMLAHGPLRPKPGQSN
jgi:hypothetical protein